MSLLWLVGWFCAGVYVGVALAVMVAFYLSDGPYDDEHWALLAVQAVVVGVGWLPIGARVVGPTLVRSLVGSVRGGDDG